MSGKYFILNNLHRKSPLFPDKKEDQQISSLRISCLCDFKYFKFSYARICIFPHLTLRFYLTDWHLLTVLVFLMARILRRKTFNFIRKKELTMSSDSNQPGCTSKKPFPLPIVFSILAVALVLTGAIVVGCSGSSSPTTSGMAKVSVMLSDPSTCMAPNGPYQHVYVTVTDIKTNVSSTAGDNDSGWVDLTPSLAGAPQQIDLLGLANNQCFLATLGDTLELQPGNYQQIRVILADDSAAGSIKNNACTNAANCVILSDGSTHILQLSSESKTGIKIPSGQIANGGFNVAAGQTKDLDIDFNTCVSIVQQGNGQYRLKPVLHAGEVSTTSSSINGTVVDNATGKPIAGEVTVALEQKDAAGVDRVFMSTLTDASGQFVFCPLPQGTYDVVIVGQNTSSVVYSPSVVTGVATGSALSTVALYALPVVSAGPATLQGQVTSQNGANPAAATGIDVQLSMLEAVSSTLTVTVPLVPNATQSSVVAAVTTVSNTACPTGTDCVNYSLNVSAGAPFVGAFSAGGAMLTQSTLPASYTVDGIAFVPSSGGTLDCSPNELKATPVTPAPGAPLPVSTLAFAGCQ